MTRKALGSLSGVLCDLEKPKKMIGEQKNNFWTDCQKLNEFECNWMNSNELE